MGGCAVYKCLCLLVPVLLGQGRISESDALEVAHEQADELTGLVASPDRVWGGCLVSVARRRAVEVVLRWRFDFIVGIHRILGSCLHLETRPR